MSEGPIMWTYTHSTTHPEVTFCDDCGEEVDPDDVGDDGCLHCDCCEAPSFTTRDRYCGGCGRASLDWKQPTDGSAPRQPFCTSCGWCALYQWDERDERKADALAKAREGWVPKAALELAVKNLLEDPLPWRNDRGKDISNENIVKHFVAEAAAKESPNGSKG